MIIGVSFVSYFRTLLKLTVKKTTANSRKIPNSWFVSVAKFLGKYCFHCTDAELAFTSNLTDNIKQTIGGFQRSWLNIFSLIILTTTIPTHWIHWTSFNEKTNCVWIHAKSSYFVERNINKFFISKSALFSDTRFSHQSAGVL